jgi:SAM-dependent MidA family methyltransferase
MSVNHNTSDLEAIIQQRIVDAGGWIPFDEFMRAALYEPGLGYYETAAVFGKEGDFVTGAQLGSWLALGYADLIRWGWGRLGSPSEWTLVEQGGGSGVLLVDVLALLQDKNIMPSKIIAIEASQQMRERQQAHYARHDLDVLSVGTIAEAVAESGALENCLMFCNELPDAFPVRCFKWHKQTLVERGVAHSQEGFIWQDASVINDDSITIDEHLKEAWPDGYVSEWNANMALWQAEVASMMKRGFLFCVDYGYSQQEYYRPQRTQGTLLGHREHQVIEDVLDKPGSCDITAHIDFTSLRRIGERLGFSAGCFMSQGAWLAQSPSVQQHVESLASSGDVESVRQLAHAKRMLMPFGMGETFKLFTQGVNIEASVPKYLKQFNRLDDLKLTKGVA